MKCKDCLWWEQSSFYEGATDPIGLCRERDAAFFGNMKELDFKIYSSKFCSKFEAHPTRPEEKTCGGCIYFWQECEQAKVDEWGECRCLPSEAHGSNCITPSKRACSKWRD